MVLKLTVSDVEWNNLKLVNLFNVYCEIITALWKRRGVKVSYKVIRISKGLGRLSSVRRYLTTRCFIRSNKWLGTTVPISFLLIVYLPFLWIT